MQSCTTTVVTIYTQGDQQIGNPTVTTVFTVFAGYRETIAPPIIFSFVIGLARLLLLPESLLCLCAFQSCCQRELWLQKDPCYTWINTQAPGRVTLWANRSFWGCVCMRRIGTDQESTVSELEFSLSGYLSMYSCSSTGKWVISVSVCFSKIHISRVWQRILYES